MHTTAQLIGRFVLATPGLTIRKLPLNSFVQLPSAWTPTAGTCSALSSHYISEAYGIGIGEESRYFRLQGNPIKVSYLCMGRHLRVNKT